MTFTSKHESGYDLNITSTLKKYILIYASFMLIYVKIIEKILNHFLFYANFMIIYVQKLFTDERTDNPKL